MFFECWLLNQLFSLSFFQFLIRRLFSFLFPSCRLGGIICLSVAVNISATLVSGTAGFFKFTVLNTSTFKERLKKLSHWKEKNFNIKNFEYTENINPCISLNHSLKGRRPTVVWRPYFAIERACWQWIKIVKLYFLEILFNSEHNLCICERWSEALSKGSSLGKIATWRIF